MDRPGIYFQGQGRSDLQSLPLSELRVQLVIVNTSARVTLSGKYINSQDSATPRCKYVFPVPASAAICAFDMRVSNGRRIKGVVKENDLAREVFEQALQAGTAAALVNYVTDDIFTISVGSIPAHSAVETNITYVLSLHNNDSYDDIRFQLPMEVGQRYGTPPAELESALAPTTETTKIKLMAQIQMSGPILSITSTSHPQEITRSSYMHNGQPSQRRSVVKFRSSTFLDRDFVLIVQALDLDKPRCFAELREDDGRKRRYSLAMQFTLVPRFILPQIASQEYIFILDRSGSMSLHGRMEQAIQTLQILLRMVPEKGSSFNVVIFDTVVESIWQVSRAYGEANLASASSWVENIQADGGTAIAQALQHALSNRRTDIPTAVFLLTDGDVTDLQPSQVVAGFVHRAPKHAPLRVFTLGIGESASTDTCESIARAGNGTFIYATSTEQIITKCARLFKAGRTPFVEDVSIDWGIPEEYLASATTVAFPHHEPSSPGTVGIRPLSNIQQSPHVIQAIHAGTRLNIYAIIALKKPFSPQEVTLRGRLQSDGSPFHTTVPIKGVQLAEVYHSKLLIHTLAAWRLVQEYTEQRLPLPIPLVQTSTSEEVQKAVLVHLGEKYQLVTKHTSFVAVESWGENGPDPPEPTPVSRTNSGAPWDDQDENNQDPPNGSHSNTDDSILSSAMTTLSHFLWGLLGGSHPRSPASGRNHRNAPGGWLDSPHSSAPTSRGDPNPDVGDDGTGNDDDGYASERTFSTLSSLESRNWSDWSEASSPGTQTPPDDEPAPPSPRLEPVSLGPASVRSAIPPQKSRKPTQQSSDSTPPQVVKLIGLQRFDGSFSLDPALGQIVGQAALQEASRLQVNDKVWATALSIAFIRKHMDGRSELLSDLLDKSMEFLAGNLNASVEDILLKAAQFV